MKAGTGHARVAVVIALVYVIVGIATTVLAGAAPSVPMRTVWRFAAWGISAVAFAVHIVYEHRLRTANRRAALYAAAAVALATLALAASAVIHQLRASSLRPVMILAFAIWPILTGVPAFLVALATGALLRHKDTLP